MIFSYFNWLQHICYAFMSDVSYSSTKSGLLQNLFVLLEYTHGYHVRQNKENIFYTAHLISRSSAS